MYFEAVSESLDRGIHLVSVKGELDLASFDRSGGRLAVVSANRSVLKVLAITGLDEVFAIYPSRAAAMNGDGDH